MARSLVRPLTEQDELVVVTLSPTVEQEISRSRRYGHPLSFALLDVDGFRKLNAGLGHAAGDEVLRGLASRLLTRSRASDMCRRCGCAVECVVFITGDKTNDVFSWSGEVDRSLPE